MATRKRRHRILKWLLGLLFLVIVVSAAVLGTSAYKIHTHIHQIEESYQRYQDHLSEGQNLEAIASLKEAATYAGDLKRETHTWYWDQARALPVLGLDVTAAQRLTNIVDNLANDALLPVFEQAEDLMGKAESSGFVYMLIEKADQTVDLLDALNDARDVAKTCLAQLNEVPESHFARLNELAEEVRSATERATSTLDDFGPLLSAADLINSL